MLVEDNVHHSVEQACLIQAVSLAVNSLPDDLRNIIILIHFENMTYEDAARSLNVGLNTFKKRLERARERLRHQLLREMD